MAFKHRITSLKRAFQCLIRKPGTDVYLSTLENCGTHWIILLLAHYFVDKFNLNVSLDKVLAPELIPKNHMDPEIKDNNIPVIRRAHHAYWFLYRGEKVIVMVRELADSLMSAYDKMEKLYGDMGFEYFIRGKYYSDDLGSVYRDLSHRVRFFNRWAEYGFDRCDTILLRYEDLQEDTSGELARVLDFLNIERSPDLIEEAVEYCSRDNMYELSEDDSRDEVKHSITMKNKRDADEYFTPEAKNFFDTYIRKNLKHDFGYGYELDN